ncbi:hypothetical protein K7X08_008192 [Anisodus acutangulus]|uniref:Uncharacterized protein n=1 Tax=Anisodus acutangulus TaxID=402998 RepID=A0A9Q1MQU8_9SOLA|nr:hypothetical protein K7X08_008192 [Anisodus acutangulus]
MDALQLLLVSPSSLVSVREKFVIKPSSLTPSTLRYHILSLVDQSLSNMYIPCAFFYPKKQTDDAITSMKNSELSHIAHLLQRSLSQTLVSYYPYAGRLRDNATVDCNDMGAEFLSVKIKCPMSEILNHPHPNAESIVFPKGLPWKNNYEGGNLLVVQISEFDCGGITVSACLSHKIGDGCSVINFLTDWARATRDHATDLVLPSPRFVGDSVFISPQNGPLVAPVIESNVNECVQKIFIFPSTKLDTLRAKVIAQSGVQNPTRADIATNEEEIELPCLVRNLRKGVELAYKKDQVEQNELVLEIVESMRNGKLPYETDEYDMYFCSNLCKFPLYSVDFGWGKPERVSLPNGPFKKMFFLKDYQTGQGLEVHVMLQKQQMSAFECDEELLEFASVPSLY